MPTIRRHPDRPGVQLLDPIEGVRYDLYVAEDEVDLEQRPDDTVPVPVDTAARVHTRRLTIPKRFDLIVRDGSLQVVGTVDPDSPTTPELTGNEPYLVEVTSAPVKLHLQLPTTFAVERQDDNLDVVFADVEPVDIAIRSFHEQPVGTITVGDSVRDEMEAISRFGSALKTTSPERAWPTLRGHPPLVERGSELAVPDGIERPTTGITLHVPPDREHIYPAAPLAYYLGARLEPTSGQPRLVAADRTVRLDPSEYTRSLNDMLRRLFVMDVAARNEGIYPFRVAVQDRIDAVVDGVVDWAGLFDMAIADRVAAYLADRFDGIASGSVLPSWHLTTDIEPGRSAFELLPWVARDLSLVRCLEEGVSRDRRPEPEPITDFLRDSGDGAGDPGAETGVGANDGDHDADGDGATDSLSPVRLPEVETPEHRWVGEGVPLQAQVPHHGALRRHLTRFPPEQTDHVISIDVVCNEAAMAGEDVVEEVYGVRDLLEYDVRTHYSLTQGELREVLQTSSDLVHYIGHVDEDGIRCVDGSLDARTMDDVNVDAFLLNACQSYDQGQALLEAGSLAGVVTLSSVNNTRATRMGLQLARLLNTGLRFRSALAILQEYLPVAYQYIVLGAGNLQLVQSASGTPHLATVVAHEPAGFDLTLSYFPASGYDVGSLVSPVFDDGDEHYLNAETVGPYTVSDDELVAVFEREDLPVDVEGELLWSSDIAMALRGDSEVALADSLAEKWGMSEDASASVVDELFRGQR